MRIMLMLPYIFSGHLHLANRYSSEHIGSRLRVLFFCVIRNYVVDKKYVVLLRLDFSLHLLCKNSPRRSCGFSDNVLYEINPYLIVPRTFHFNTSSRETLICS